MSGLALEHVYKIYDNGYEAVKDFNLSVTTGEFIVFVGPSGCGKSTTLRMIAGLEEITKGTLTIDDKVMNEVEPKDRDIAMVFQSYALYPHMTVYDNMAFALKLRKLPKDKIDQLVRDAAETLGLTEVLDRKPKQLSGGQRQRVALGRSVVREPKVFLMDEPLSNLDAKLRGHMRAEIIKLHKRVGATTIYVTHDQVEAMTMADRIVVMNAGVIQQIDAPKVLYDQPANMFVAGFIGAPAMNFFTVPYHDGKITLGGKEITVPGSKAKALDAAGKNGKDVVFAIRPEDIATPVIVKNTFPDAVFTATIDFSELLGHDYHLHFSYGGNDVISKTEARHIISSGDTVEFVFDMNKSHFFDVETEKVIK